MEIRNKRPPNIVARMFSEMIPGQPWTFPNSGADKIYARLDMAESGVQRDNRSLYVDLCTGKVYVAYDFPVIPLKAFVGIEGRLHDDLSSLEPA